MLKLPSPSHPKSMHTPARGKLLLFKQQSVRFNINFMSISPHTAILVKDGWIQIKVLFIGAEGNKTSSVLRFCKGGINLPKLVNICGYELPTNVQSFMQKDLSLTEAKILLKVLKGLLYFESPCTSVINSAHTHTTW